MKKIKLYQLLSEKRVNKFLKTMGTTLELERLVEIKNKEEDFYGDFLVIGGYKLKYTYGRYHCMETPTDKHKPATLNAKKAPNDHYDWGR